MITKHFSTVTLQDCEREDGLGLDLSHAGEHSILLPSWARDVSPLEFTCQTLDRAEKIGGDLGYRTKMTAVLLDLASRNDLKITSDIDNCWKGDGIQYTGNLGDYVLGKGISNDCFDPLMVIIHVKNGCLEVSAAQAIARAGCLLRRQMNKEDMSPVFALLSDSRDFQFFAIDVDSVVYCNGAPVTLTSGPNDNWQSSSSLAKILKWMCWFVDLKQSQNISKFRECLVPRRIGSENTAVNR